MNCPQCENTVLDVVGKVHMRHTVDFGADEVEDIIDSEILDSWVTDARVTCCKCGHAWLPGHSVDIGC